MKKILVCLIGIMFVLPFGAVAQNVCGSNQQSYQGVQNVNDDEFLYNSEEAWKKAHKKDDNGNEQCKNSCFLGNSDKDTTKKVFECDKEQGCGRGTYILTNKDFYWAGKSTGEVAMFCEISGFNDRWMKIKIKDCDELFNVYPEINRSTEYIKNFTGKECYETTYGVCCYGINKGQDIVTPDVKPRCKELRTETVGKACCDIPASKARYDEKENTCTCYGSFVFKHDGERGWCEPKKTDETNEIVCPDGSESGSLTCSGDTHVECTFWNGDTCECAKCVNDWKETEVVEQFSCGADIISQITQWKDECSDVTKYANILNAINQIHMYCGRSNGSYQELKVLYDELVSLNPYQCAESTSIVISQATQRINAAVDSLRSYVSDLEVSKWKDKEGKFNTARLASDSIAGVVLGTAGGLITSNVVKKHQVEDGFEDLQCVIGGQTVAGWGDEFTVGVH